MAATTIEQEMLELENQYWKAIKDSDVAAAQRATDDPCIVAGASGAATIDSTTFAQMMGGANWKVNGFEISGIQVRELSPDVRITAYQVHEDLTVDGEPVRMDAADTSVWVKRSGDWKCAMHTESLLGDAYGRDRVKQ